MNPANHYACPVRIDLGHLLRFVHNIFEAFQNAKCRDHLELYQNIYDGASFAKLLKNVNVYIFHHVKNPSQLTFTFSKSAMETIDKRCEICSKLTMKTQERHQSSNSGNFIVNLERISHLFLVFLLLNLNKYMLAGIDNWWGKYASEICEKFLSPLLCKSLWTNQSIDLLCISIDWLLHDGNLGL